MSVYVYEILALGILGCLMRNENFQKPFFSAPSMSHWAYMSKIKVVGLMKWPVANTKIKREKTIKNWKTSGVSERQGQGRNIIRAQEDQIEHCRIQISCYWMFANYFSYSRLFLVITMQCPFDYKWHLLLDNIHSHELSVDSTAIE